MINILKLIVPLQFGCIILLGFRIIRLTEEKDKLEKVLREDHRFIFKMAKKIGRLQKQLKEEG